MKIFTTLAIASLLALGAGSVTAGEKGMKHTAADYNKDGMVTHAELVNYVEMKFMTMDKNNDKMLDDSEFDEIFNTYD